MLLFIALAFSPSFSQEIIRDRNHLVSPQAGWLAPIRLARRDRPDKTGSAARLDSIPTLLGSSCGSEADRRHGLTDYEAPPSSLFFPLTHRQTRTADYLTRALHPTPAVFMRLAQGLGRYRHSVAVPSEPLFMLPTLSVLVSSLHPSLSALSPPTGQPRILAVLPCVEPRPLLSCSR